MYETLTDQVERLLILENNNKGVQEQKQKQLIKSLDYWIVRKTQYTKLSQK